MWERVIYMITPRCLIELRSPFYPFPAVNNVTLTDLYSGLRPSSVTMIH